MPYADELIYSTIARAGVRAGIHSPKQLLEAVFNDRKVVATFDMPCQLDKIVNLYLDNQYDFEELIYQNTLFPIFAPFMPEERRQKCIHWMRESSQGSVHLASGLNASRLPVLRRARYCPECVEGQINQNGEGYWSRHWQVIGAECCLIHQKQLIDSTLDLRSAHRHNFSPIFEHFTTGIYQNNRIATKDEIFLTEKVISLFLVQPIKSASYAQWTGFYKNLALSNDCIKGTTHVVFDRIRDKFIARWDSRLLEQFNLDDLETDNNWLVSIFRKHRKSFSYIQHVLVIEAFWGEAWSFETILKSAKSLRTTKGKIPRKIPQSIVTETPLKRKKWLNQLAKNDFRIKQTRTANNALYAWLYRNDKTWLVNEHRKYQRKHISTNDKFDWNQRDRGFTRELIGIKNNIIVDVNGVRRSKNFWLKQTMNPSLVEKNLSKLPLVNKFLSRYSEDISDYQIRRLTRTYLNRIAIQESLSEWIILRESGLSEERLTDEAKRFFEAVQSIVLQNTKGV